MIESTLATPVAEIVSAYLKANPMPSSELPAFIVAVGRALSGQCNQRSSLEPAVPIAESHTREEVACLECGKRFRMLKRHLQIDHNLTPDQYREKWSLPTSYSLVSEAYSEERSAIAHNTGLGLGRASKRDQGGR